MAFELSIVIPLYNEEKNIPSLLAEIESVLSRHNLNAELVFVNDGSTDGSAVILSELAAKNTFIKPVHLKQNSGQSFAIKTGIENASADVITFLDADLQNDANSLPAMLKLMTQYEAVLGYRQNRQDNLWKRWSSFMGNKLIQLLFSSKIIDSGCSLKVCRKQDLASIPYFKNYHRYINLILEKKGVRLTQVPTSHRKRTEGEGKYSPFKFLKVLRELWYLKFTYFQ